MVAKGTDVVVVVLNTVTTQTEPLDTMADLDIVPLDRPPVEAVPDPADLLLVEAIDRLLLASVDALDVFKVESDTVRRLLL